VPSSSACASASGRTPIAKASKGNDCCFATRKRTCAASVPAQPDLSGRCPWCSICAAYKTQSLNQSWLLAPNSRQYRRDSTDGSRLQPARKGVCGRGGGFAPPRRGLPASRFSRPLTFGSAERRRAPRGQRDAQSDDIRALDSGEVYACLQDAMRLSCAWCVQCAGSYEAVRARRLLRRFQSREGESKLSGRQ
jgi:hypothetical protein